MKSYAIYKRVFVNEAHESSPVTLKALLDGTDLAVDFIAVKFWIYSRRAAEWRNTPQYSNGRHTYGKESVGHLCSDKYISSETHLEGTILHVLTMMG